MVDEDSIIEIRKQDEQILEFEILSKQINFPAIEEKVASHIVFDENSAKEGLSMALQMRKLKNQVEASRDEIIRPILDYQKDINKIVKDLRSKIESIEQRLQEKISAWMEQEKKDNIFHSVDQIEVEDGTISCRKVWDFEIENILLIQRSYLVPDEKLIKDLIKKGVRTIPGIKIFEKEEFQMRVKN